MTRGRRKDMTIPPSRALLQQRDYRARKAQYLAELEGRVKKAEDDNAVLRQELDSLHAKLKAAGPAQQPPSPYGPEVAAASSDLIHHLTIAAASIKRFQQLAFYPSSSSSGPAPHVNRAPITLATPTYTPSPVPPPHKLSVSPRIELPPLTSAAHDVAASRHYRDPLPAAYPRRSLPSTAMGPAPHARYPRPRDPDCCGGYLDCRDLVEDEDMDEMDMDDDASSDGRSRRKFSQRMSDVRSTASPYSSGPEEGSVHSHPSVAASPPSLQDDSASLLMLAPLRPRTIDVFS